MSKQRSISAFLAALLSDPADNTTRAIFADWLEEQDLPHYQAMSDLLRMQMHPYTVKGIGLPKVQELLGALDHPDFCFTTDEKAALMDVHPAHEELRQALFGDHLLSLVQQVNSVGRLVSAWNPTQRDSRKSALRRELRDLARFLHNSQDPEPESTYPMSYYGSTLEAEVHLLCQHLNELPTHLKENQRCSTLLIALEDLVNRSYRPLRDQARPQEKQPVKRFHRRTPPEIGGH